MPLGSASTDDEPRSAASILGSFDLADFEPGRRWPYLKSILQNRRGGSFGISGGRGTGKTWLMTRALRWAEDEPQAGIGVWFPSPSEYDPIAFLASLCDVTALRFQEFYDRRTGRQTRIASVRFWRYLAVAYVLLLVAALVVLTTMYSIDVGLLVAYAIAAALVTVAGALATVAGRRRALEKEGLGQVRQRAEEMRVQVRYVSSLRSTTEIGAEAGKSIVGRFSRTREQALVERPATLSTLVHAFRDFVASAAKEIDGPVVIAVDELDKMLDVRAVAGLLRDIKGVFELPGVHFLVSISDEAARSLELGTIKTRDEFNSSFYTVIHLKSMSPVNCVKVLRRRNLGTPRNVATAVAILSGGNPREFVRIADRVLRSSEDPDVETAVVAVLGEEIEAFRDEVFTAPSHKGRRVASVSSSDKARIDTLLDAWDDPGDDDAALGGKIKTLAVELWAPEGFSSAWEDRFSEQWRRLLIRLFVMGLLLEDTSRLGRLDDVGFLQEVVARAAASSEVAAAMLARRGFMSAPPSGTRTPTGKREE